MAVMALVIPPSADAAVRYFSTTKMVKGVGKVSCPAGHRVTGGGYYLPSDVVADNTKYWFRAQYSRPLATGQGWEASARKVTNGSVWTQPYAPTVYAICIK